MAEYSINKITLPNGDVVDLLDETSGYTKAFRVTFTQSGSSYTTDKTFAEAVEAYENGSILFALDGLTSYKIYPLTAVSYNNGVIYTFTFSRAAAGTIYSYVWMLYNGNITITYTTKQIPNAGTTVTAVGTTADAGSAATWSKSDHVHSISSDTIESVVGELSTSDISTGTDTDPKLVSAKTISDALSGFGGGTVTSVGLTNASGETDFTITGSPVTSAGTITIEHANSVTAKTTQGLYPITFDKHGHITGSGNAVTIPTVNDGALKLQKNSETAASIYTANQSGDTTVKFETTSVGSASGWNAGTVPTLGTAISADDITSWATNTPTTIDTTKFSGGSFTRGTFSGGSFTQGTDSFTANSPTKIDTTKFSGGSFTRGTFSGGSFTQGTDSFTAATLSGSVASAGATVSNPTTLTLSFNGGSFTQGSDSFTAATHAADSFTAAALNNGFYTAGTSASFTQGTDSFTAATHANDSFTAASLNTGFYTAGSAASLSYTSRSIPNVTSVGTTPSLTISSTTVVSNISKVTS